MDEITLRTVLSELPLGGLKHFEQTASTNDVAMAWAAQGAADLALVYAEEQTSGRGRGHRIWYTPARTGLAFSLVIRPTPGEQKSVALFSGLGALAVCEALDLRSLHPRIKWPNDVLLGKRKVCGVLVEAAWLGEKVDSIVLGVGVNVRSEAVPLPDQLDFPATCIDNETGKCVDRLLLLKDILQALLYWRRLLAQDVLIHTWEKYLAFRGEQVEILAEGIPCKTGVMEGLDRDGSLRLRSHDGRRFSVQYGQVHLRPVL
jgi:BirA family biotin operon repressor/biotin-[acetyl-CoA-carboxylase] ligase